jgi:plastocyanin
MKLVMLALVSVLGLASAAAGGNIDGTIEGWSEEPHSSRLPAVVWLEGVNMPATNKKDPVMTQRGGQFVPSFLVVVAGQSVDMPNEDEVAHNVYSVSDAKSFNLGYYAKGELKAVTFDRPGMVDVLCLIHSFMRAKILVVPNPYYSLVAADGSFHIHNAPTGRFVLAFWGEGITSSVQEIAVPAGSKPISVQLPAQNTAPRR